MKRKRQVKEGSPFEEENLLDMLREEVLCTQEDREFVKSIINALVYFQQIESSMQIHSLVEKLMRAKNFVDKLMSVEQMTILKEQPDIQEYYFGDKLGFAKTDEDFTQQAAEW